MAIESAKVTLGEFVKGLNVFQVVTCLVLAVTTILAFWSWRDGLVSEKTALQAHLIQADARNDLLAASLEKKDTTIQSLHQTSRELRADLAKRSAVNSRGQTCAFIQKEIGSVKTDIINAREPLMVFGETNMDREERSKYLTRLDDQLRTLTRSLEGCTR